MKVIRPSPESSLESPAGGGDPLADLARKAAGRERKAMRALVTEVGPVMLRMIRRVMGRATLDVEDVMQEAVEGLLEALPTFRGNSTIRHFACRIAVFCALGARRRENFRGQFSRDAPDAVETSADPQPSPVDGLAISRRREALNMLLDELPHPQAEVLVLHTALGFTVEEIAASVGSPVETVRSRLRLAKQTLRERIGASSDLAEILEVQR